MESSQPFESIQHHSKDLQININNRHKNETFHVGNFTSTRVRYNSNFFVYCVENVPVYCKVD